MGLDCILDYTIGRQIFKQSDDYEGTLYYTTTTVTTTTTTTTLLLLLLHYYYYWYQAYTIFTIPTTYFVYYSATTFFFLLFFPSHLLSSPFLVVTQIRGHIAGSSPPLPTTVRALHFYRENISALSSLVDSRRIVLTDARRSQQLILFFIFATKFEVWPRRDSN